MPIVAVHNTTTAVSTILPKLNETERFLVSPQAAKLYDHIARAGGISAAEAMQDYGITSATLARRMCDLELIDKKVVRTRKVHPITGRRYTRYSIAR